MTEQELQRIEKGFAAGTPLKYYNPHGDRLTVDIMIDLESRTIVPALIAEVRRLQTILDEMTGDLADATGRTRAEIEGAYALAPSEIAQ